MPRKPKLLPYLQMMASGRLRYTRRVPPDLRDFLGGRGYLTVLMPPEATDPADKRLTKAWSKANTQVEAELAEARAKQEAKASAIEPAESLSPRAVAGIAAEPWRQLRNAMAEGRVTAEMDAQVRETVLITLNALAEAQKTGDPAVKAAAQKQITDIWIKKIVDDLGIDPSGAVMDQIRARHQAYRPMAEADADRLRKGDFSTSDLESKAPPLPAKQVTFEAMVDEWIRDAGGIREVDGVGIGKAQVSQYRAHIKELIEVTGMHFPAEVDVDSARAFMNHLQESDLAIATKKTRMTTVNNLFAVAVRVGLLDTNPFTHLKIKTPKGTRNTGYRPFTEEELTEIFSELKRIPPNERNILPLMLLTTGGRQGDITFIRHQDVQKSEGGVWFIDMVDCPKDKYPRTLKGGVSDERRTPIHPVAIDRGFLEMVRSKKKGYVFQARRNDTLSAWFKRLLERIGIYEHRKTGLHSLRNNAIDAWREARIPQDIRHALTGHSSRSVQDKSYGEGLQQMPDVLYKELVKIDWSWLP